MKRINLISSPRNISTALMYSFAQRSDTHVIDEPLYGYYLQLTSADHPGKDEIIRTMETDPTAIIASLLQPTEKTVLFIKNMAHHHVHQVEERYFSSVTNVFLIRDPKQLIGSFAEVIHNPTMTDIGIARQCELYDYAQRLGQQPPVLDSGELLKNPEAVLQKLCHCLEIRFEKSMLSWKPGPRREDGIWAKYWYQNVHRSSGFQPQPTSNRSLPDYLMPLYEEARPYYEKLFEHSLKA